MAVGAILYFALNMRVAHVDIDVIGVILVIAGAAGPLFGPVQKAMWTRWVREVSVDDRRLQPRY